MFSFKITGRVLYKDSTLDSATLDRMFRYLKQFRTQFTDLAFATVFKAKTAADDGRLKICYCGSFWVAHFFFRFALLN